MEKDPVKKIKAHTRYHKTFKDQGHWRSRKKIDPDNYFGFTYITEVNGLYYVGRKSFIKKGTKQVKGKRKKIWKKSDWKTYTTSSVEVNRMIEEGANPKFYHIASWNTLGAEVYHEYHMMARFNVIMDGGFLNGMIPKTYKPIGKSMDELKEYFKQWGSI